MKKIAAVLLTVIALGSTVSFAQDGFDRTPLGQKVVEQQK